MDLTHLIKQSVRVHKVYKYYAMAQHGWQVERYHKRK